ncbi:hypothetical protein VB716_08580 [Synechococcus sp. CCY9201]|uniref:hypothetical protein n=1 Tax=Synechococcus sp. CCY9201 TaxID=174697 RepID=UPI002B1FD0FD|nr:hypothetical protein [Synechococcus sp. CCY9201]MEA5474275.1 hypothetical protein [Synechococcus sp. CCY9201]
MAESSIDLLALNREILLNPKTAASNHLVALLELEKPGLEFLCPMAKAIYLLETNRSHLVNPTEALLGCLLVDYTFSGVPGTDEYASVTEQVHHVIETRFAGRDIVLGFESTGGMLHYSSFWSDYLRTVWAKKWNLDLISRPHEFIENIFCFLGDDARQATPSAYPSDKGEFLGSVSYVMTNINGIDIQGPEYTNSGCDDEWAGLSDKFSQRYPGTRCDSDGHMCWLHYLEERDAKRLGIWSDGNEAIGENDDYPEWVSNKVSEKELEETWISPDELQSSYMRGKLAFEESTIAWLAIGCGEDWYPGQLEDDDQGHNKEEDGGIFDPMSRPLIEIEIEKEAKVLPDELLTLAPYLIKLHQMLN